MILDATQLRYLAQRVGLIRSDWTTAALSNAVDHLPDHLDFMAVLSAAEHAARDTDAKTPGVLWAYWSKYSAAPGRRSAVAAPSVPASPEFVTRLHAESAAGNPLPFPGPWCWRHDDLVGGRRPAVAPYDECAECLDERHLTNEWREDRGQAIRPPVLAAPRPW